MKTIILLIAVSVFCGCSCNKKLIQQTNLIQSTFAIVNENNQHLFVYKTKADYYNFVPVILTEDKSKIISYPDPLDVKLDGKSQMPTILHEGYLLDNRGINKNIAFINITYEDYARLKTIPSLTELYNLIIDNDPLIELYDCGIKSGAIDDFNKINRLIDNKKLRAETKVIK